MKIYGYNTWNDLESKSGAMLRLEEVENMRDRYNILKSRIVRK